MGPTLAAADEVLAMGDQPLVQLAGEHRDAVHPGVVSEPVAGHADLAATGLEQHSLIELGPLLDRGFNPGGQGRGPGQGDTHEPLQMRTPVLARDCSPRLRCVHIFPESVVAVRVGIRELRARLASHLETATPIEVTRHGRTVGLYVPLPQESDLSEHERLLEAGRLMQAELQRLGLTEEELAADFKDWRRAQQQQANA
jgi:antitoxin (DNA-binding transcriptional repressor) of toxin-antitoxin stability system